MEIRGKPFFVKIFVSYVALLSLLFVMGAVLYVHASREVTTQIERQGEETLLQVEKAFNAEFQNVEMMLTQISMRPEVRAFLLKERESEAEDAYRLNQIIKSLSSYSLLSDFIANYYIWFWKNDYVVSRFYAYRSRDFFRLCYGEGEAEYEKWAASKKAKTPYIGYERTVHSDFEGSGMRRNIEYGISLPLGVGSALGCITAMIDESQVQKLLSQSAPWGLGYAYIADAKGTIVSFYGDTNLDVCQPASLPQGDHGHFTQGRGKKRLSISFARSSDRKWQYVVACAPSQMLRPVVRMQIRYLILLGVLLVLSLCAIVVLSFRQSRPLREIANSLAAEDFLAHDLGSLKDAVNSLIRDHNAISEERAKQDAFLRSVFLLRLLQGAMTGGQNAVAREMERFGVLEAKRYQAVLMRFEEKEGGASLSDIRLVVKRKAEELSGDFRLEALDIDEGTIAFICFSDAEDNAQGASLVRMWFDDLSKEVRRVFNLPQIVVFGSVVDTPSRIQDSYGQASYALQNRLLGGGGLDTGSEGGAGYPLALEMQLVNATFEGDVDTLETVLSNLFRQNDMFVHADNEQLRLTLAALKNTLMRILQSAFGSTEEASRWKKQVETLERLDLEEVKSVFVQVSQALDMQRKESQGDFSRKMRSYVDAHCLEWCFSLTSVSDHFRLNESYVSTYFKKHYHVNFLTYVKKRRLDEAARLLRGTEMPIEDIARMIGYTSGHSMRRAFKERYGVGPAEYRSRS